MLSDVPFAALRKPNSPVGEGYFIQSHTISVMPSLRILQYCNQRLEELNQDAPLDTKPGTIVAVGDPAYENPDDRLEASGEEVNSIEELFGKEHVKKLVGPEATPSEVLKWAKYPSENRVKQVIFHIAAHGIGQDVKKVKKGGIVLARPASRQRNCGKLGISVLLVMGKAVMLTQVHAHGSLGNSNSLPCIYSKKIVMRR
jgi:CHAT domain-containing protein